MVYEFEFQFEQTPNIWLRTDVTIADALACLKTGLLRNQVVTKVKLFAITESSTTVAFVYDITAAKSGNTPWSTLSTTAS